MQSNAFYRFMSWVTLVAYLQTTLWTSAYAGRAPLMHCSAEFGEGNVTLRIQPSANHFPNIDYLKENPRDFTQSETFGSFQLETRRKATDVLKTTRQLDALIDSLIGFQEPNLGSTVEEIIEKNETAGVAWSVAGVGVVHVDKNGAIHVQGHKDQTPISSLKVVTTGKVFLEDLYAKHLDIAAQYVYAAQNVKVDRLDLDLGGTSTDENVTGPSKIETNTHVFAVGAGNTFETTNLNLKNGSLINHGLVTLTGDAKLDLWGGHFLNAGTVSGDNWKVAQAGFAVNCGQWQGRKFQVESSYLSNHKTIKGDQVAITLGIGGENLGRIDSSQSTKLKTVTHWHNKGTVTSAGQQDIIVGGNFKNSGTLSANKQKVKVAASTENRGKIHAEQDAHYSLGDLHNFAEGKIGSHKNTTLQVRSGESSGDIYGRQHLEFDLKGEFSNRGKLGSGADKVTSSDAGSDVQQEQTLGNLHLKLGKDAALLNDSDMAAANIVVQGDGKLANHGSIYSHKDLQLKHRELVNTGVVKSDGALGLHLQQKLDNQQGTIQGKTGSVSGKALITNAAGEKPHLGMSFESNLHFDQFKGHVQNTGWIASGGKVTGTLNSLDNRGIFETTRDDTNHNATNAGYDLTINKLSNEHNLLGGGSIRVGKGRNKGIIAGEGLSLNARKKFINAGQLGLQTLQGLGTFVNNNHLDMQGKASNPGLIDVRQFENRSPQAAKGVTGTHLQFGPNIQKWFNEDESKITTDQLTFQVGLKEKSTVNQGVIKSKNQTIARKSFINEGLLATDSLELSGNSFTNALAGEIEIKQHLKANLQSFVNAGDLSAGKFAGEITDVSNKGTFELKQNSDLSGTNFTNSGKFITEDLWQWRGENFTNTRHFATKRADVNAKKQLINKGHIRFKGKLQASHIANLGVITTDIKTQADLRKDFQSLKKPIKAQSVPFKPHTFANLGSIVGQAGQKNPLKITGNKLTNQGHLSAELLNFNVKHLENHGRLQSTQNITGSIGKLENFNWFGSLSGTTRLKGDHLSNHGTLYGKTGVYYNGRLVENHKKGGIYSNKQIELTATKAVENAGNLSSPDAKQAGPLQSLQIKTRTFSNTGFVSADAADMRNVYTLNNSGTLQTYQDTKWWITVIENSGLLQSVQGKIDLKGSRLINKGKIAGQSGVTYEGRRLENQKDAEISSPESVEITVKEDVQNKGKILGAKKLSFNGQEVLNWGELISNGLDNFWNLSSKFKNWGHIKVKGVQLTTPELLNHKELLIFKKGYIKANSIDNKSIVLDNNEMQGGIIGEKDLTIVADTVKNDGFIVGQSNLNLTVNKLEGTNKQNLRSRGTLTLDLGSDYVHKGWLEARHLKLKGRKFKNQATIKSSRTADLDFSWFNNEEGALADLTGLRWSKNSYQRSLFNSGHMYLRQVQDMQNIRSIYNWGNFKLCDSNLQLKELKNTGSFTIKRSGLDIKKTIENSYGSHLFLQDIDEVKFKDIDNAGKIHSNKGLKLTAGSYLERLGTFLVEGDFDATVDAKVRRHLDLGKVLKTANLIYNGTLNIDADNYTHTGRLGLPAEFKLQGRDVRLPGHINFNVHNLLNQGTIDTCGAISIDATGVVNNSFGRIAGSGVDIVADGPIYNGASVSTMRNGKQFYRRNGAHIVSRGQHNRLRLRSIRGDINNDYGEILTQGPLIFEAIGHMVSNVAGVIRGQTSGIIKARRLDVTREAQGEKQVRDTSKDRHWREGSWPKRRNKFKPGYSTSCWEQSGPARLEIGNTFGDSRTGGYLYLGVDELNVIASSVFANGLLYAKNGREIRGSNWPSNYKIQNRNGHQATFRGRKLLYVDVGHMTLTGSASGAEIVFNLQDFWMENVDNRRSNPLPNTRCIFNLTDIIKEHFVTENGLFQDAGEHDTRSQHRFTSTTALEHTPQPAMDQLVFLGREPENMHRTRFAASPVLADLAASQIINQFGTYLDQIGAEITQRLHEHALNTDCKVMTFEQFKQQTESMIIYRVRKIYDACLDVAQSQQRYQEEDYQEEVDALLILAAKDKAKQGVGSGSMASDKDTHIFTENDATFVSSHSAAGGKLLVRTGGKLVARNKVNHSVWHNGNTTIVRNLLGPQVTFHAGNDDLILVSDGDCKIAGAELCSDAKDIYVGSQNGNTNLTGQAATTTSTTVNKSRKSTEVISNSQQKLRPTNLNAPKGNIHEFANRQTGQLNLTYVHSVAGKNTELSAHKAKVDAGVEKATNSVAVKKRRSNFGDSSTTANLKRSAIVSGQTTTVAADMAEILGTDIRCKSFEDKTNVLKLGCQLFEQQHTSYHNRKGYFGKSSRNTVGGRDVAGVTTLMAEFWQSLGEGELVLESVIAEGIKEFLCNKTLTEKTSQPRSWQHTTTKKKGLSAPCLNHGFNEPLVSCVKGLGHAKTDGEKMTASAQMVSEGIKTAFDIARAFSGDPSGLLSRWTTVSMGASKSSSFQESKQAIPNNLNIEVMVLAGPKTHLEGHHNIKKLVMLSDEFSTAATFDEARQEQKSKSKSASLNLMTMTPGFSFSQQKQSSRSKKAHASKINVDHLFLRCNQAVISGTQLRARLVDAVLKKSLTIESVMDESSSKSSGKSFSTSGDFFFMNKKQRDQAVDEYANFFGAERFYLKVAEKMLTKSADFGLRTEGAVLESKRTAEGRELYLREMPHLGVHSQLWDDSACGFWGILADTGEKDVRKSGSKKLLQHSTDPEIRALVAPEIKEALLRKAGEIKLTI